MSKIVFGYQGLDKQGVPARGTVEALDKQDALKKLRLLEAQGLHDLSIGGVQQLNGSPSPASTETAKRFCGHCGVENSAEHRFCAGCGKPLGEAVQGQSVGRPAAKGQQGWTQSTMKPWHGVFFLICMGVSVWVAFFSTMPKSTSRPSSSPSASAAATAARNERLEKIMLDQYRDNGVVKVEVDGPVMVLHVTAATYRLLLSDRVEGNRIMRGWQNLVAQNDGMMGAGVVTLYSEGHQVAEADKDLRSGEIKVRWFDE